MSQTWDVTFVPASSGFGNTQSAGGDSGVTAIQSWPLTLNTGAVGVAGSGNTTSTGVGAGTAVLLDQYSIDATVGSGGFGTTTSTGVGSGSVVNPTIRVGSGFGNTQSGAGNLLLPGGNTFVRPFFAPLDIGSVTAPLDIGSVTAPLDMNMEAT